MAGEGGGGGGEHYIIKHYECCETRFFAHIIISAALVLFAGVMNGLTLRLMSISRVDLEVLVNSGTPRDSLHASKILPVVKRRHLLLCTLLFSDFVAMTALPLFLDNLVKDWSAILISATLILVFAEIIPHSVSSRYRLVIGASLAPIVHVLLWVCFPVAYPISKLLDILLGERPEPLFRRVELKTLVDLHSTEAGKGGELSVHETSIITGALELTEKTARDAMTPISETFSIDINAKLDRNLICLISAKGHSRVPVYYQQPGKIIGLILVKNLLNIHPADEVPVKNVTLRGIPRVSEIMPLYDILKEFQKGLSHMVAVVREHGIMVEQPANKHTVYDLVSEVRVDIHSERAHHKRSLKSSFNKLNGLSGRANILCRETSKSRRWSDHFHPEILHIDDNPLATFIEEGEVIGIITMEDVIEELFKEDIYDEMDHRGSSRRA